MKWYKAVDLNLSEQLGELFLIYWPQFKSKRFNNFILHLHR